MKKILLLFVLSVLVQYANAQIIAMHPDTTYLSTSGNVTVNGFATIVNFSADTPKKFVFDTVASYLQDQHLQVEQQVLKDLGFMLQTPTETQNDKMNPLRS